MTTFYRIAGQSYVAYYYVRREPDGSVVLSKRYASEERMVKDAKS